MGELNRKEQEEAELDEIFDELDELDKAIIRVKIEKPAISNVALSEMFEVNEHKIGRRLKKDKVINAISGLQKRALDIILDLQAEGARYLGKVLRDKNEKTINRLRATREILKGVLAENINLNLNDEEIQKKLDDIRMKHADKPDMG